MKVSAQYAEEHFSELASAAYNGDSIEIESPEKPTLHLVAVQKPVAVRPRSELLGSMRGKFHLSDDWDSPELNAEIAAEFENSEIFPR